MILDVVLQVEGSIERAPSFDVVLVKEEARTFTVRVHAIPLGYSLERLVWTGKAVASDADSAIRFQKTVTTTLSNGSQIIDTGSSTRIALVTVAFAAADLPDTLPDALVHQVWGVVYDGSSIRRQSCAARGTVALSPPIPFALP